MLYKLDAASVAKKVAGRELSSEEYIHQVLERIEKVEPKVNAFITVNKKAVEQARALDREIRDGKPAGPLAGVAVAVKDNISTKGIRTTCASRMLDDYVPPYDATVVRRLQDAGAIIVGKVNLDEFAMGSTTEFSRHGPTRNPWDISRVPGGSSGGSAASVAALECAVSLGSDTGGSVRCPASFCSVVGLKPTYGLVSRFGLVSYANSLEQVGPAGRTVADVATVLGVIAGFDEHDNTTAAGRPSYSAYKKRPLRVGLVKEFIEGADEQVVKIIRGAVDTLAKEGCACEETSLPSVKYALASYYTIAMAEASSNLSRYDNMRYGFESSPEGYEWNSYFSHARGNFGEEVKRRIITGSYVLSSGYYGKYYLKAQQARSIIRKELKSLFKKYDVLAGPTMPILPFKIGEKIDDPLKMYLVDVDTVVANLAGVPAISVPAGFAGGLPVGLQLMADEFCEQTLFDAAGMFEQAAGVRGSPDL
ncbi:MAG: Asp-tRNA(Asn)/Glu-tRNA(Gln) amidotransferase subunit GatA [Nitrososphaera sp.]|uniref:Asp-tRNA(Asn)/Glu-tRNA(Gln) amidotransferase subunit GatA n=1 Tax=Nitrososphaera sp. TaxID=1971748 RepID=UPI0017E7388D|nr:Asp-tRNA(Asn)/Glu-tRNA(Gln) amidotransferase subunit GatA [Nitrososphaera sp.]NWG37754.1 Asp-tRNA(Asn)/Glu-tRNA(Gln) amidotransferase subunit GatA [Nitrososphaera sp.]